MCTSQRDWTKDNIVSTSPHGPPPLIHLIQFVFRKCRMLIWLRFEISNKRRNIYIKKKLELSLADRLFVVCAPFFFRHCLLPWCISLSQTGSFHSWQFYSMHVQSAKLQIKHMHYAHERPNKRLRRRCANSSGSLFPRNQMYISSTTTTKAKQNGERNSNNNNNIIGDWMKDEGKKKHDELLTATKQFISYIISCVWYVRNIVWTQHFVCWKLTYKISGTLLAIALLPFPLLSHSQCFVASGSNCAKNAHCTFPEQFQPTTKKSRKWQHHMLYSAILHPHCVRKQWPNVENWSFFN